MTTRLRTAWTMIAPVLVWIVLFGAWTPLGVQAQTVPSTCPRIDPGIDVSGEYQTTIELHLSVEPALANPVSLKFNDSQQYDLTSKDLEEPWQVSSGDPLVIPAGGHRNVTLHVAQPNPGLVRLEATPLGPWPGAGQGTALCPGLNVILNTGFSRLATLSIDNSNFACECHGYKEPTSAADPGELQHFSFRFKNSDGQPVAVAEPLTVEFSSTDTPLSADNQAWNKPVQFTIQGYDFQNVFVRPSVWSSRRQVQATVKLDRNGPNLLKCQIVYASLLPWWLLVFGAISGSLVYVVLNALVNSRGDLRTWWNTIRVNQGSTILMALAAGCVGFAGRNLDMWGFKVQATTFGGAAVLGFVAAAAGLESILSKLKKVFGQS